MKFKLMATTIAFLTTFLGWKSTPIEDGKLAMSEDEQKKLKEKMGDETAQQIIDAINKEIEQVSKNEQNNAELANANAELEKVKAEVAKMLAGTNLSEEEKENVLAGNGEGGADLTAQLKALQAAQKKQDETIAKLMKDPEGDSPIDTIKRNAGNMKHSATHLFATGKSYDAFEKRPWNQRLRDGGIKATDFNSDSNIPLLQDDLEHFVRENPTQLESLFNDFEDLPKEWDRRSGVLDRVSDAAIITGEIVQGRAKGWAPKNKFKIAAEEGRVFRKKIDISFTGYELQEIENTWIRSYNKEGSHPWKMSFIGFLLGEIVKQQKLDDRKAQINGIYVQSPEGHAGAAVNSQDGLLYLYHHYRDIAKKYRPFNLGEPTKANIVDYIKQAIELIPQEERNQSGMEIQLSHELLTWYREKAATVYQVHRSSDEGKLAYGLDYPIDYPNFKFQPLKDMTRTKFIAFVKSNNVQIMDYNASEKGKFTITHTQRNTDIFADYRLGIRLKFVGTKLLSGEPANFERQVVWSNDMPIFDSSVSVPVFDDETGRIALHYNHVKVDSAWKTDIAEIEGATAGQVVRITGNTSLAGVKYVKKNASLVLASDFPLNNGGTLTMYVQADGTFKELSRTTEPAAASTTDNTYDGATIDANNSTTFEYDGAGAVTITEILNGVDGKVITIAGGAGGAVTLASVTGNISLASGAVLADGADSITLVRIEGVWTEVERTIAA